jgi:hypothetical protein
VTDRAEGGYPSIRSFSCGESASMGYLLPNGKTLPAEKDLQAPCEMISGLRGVLQSGHENCSKRLAVGEKNWSCPSIDDVGE